MKSYKSLTILLITAILLSFMAGFLTPIILERSLSQPYIIHYVLMDVGFKIVEEVGPPNPSPPTAEREFPKGMFIILAHNFLSTVFRPILITLFFIFLTFIEPRIGKFNGRSSKLFSLASVLPMIIPPSATAYQGGVVAYTLPSIDGYLPIFLEILSSAVLSAPFMVFYKMNVETVTPENIHSENLHKLLLENFRGVLGLLLDAVVVSFPILFLSALIEYQYAVVQ